jgi:hypothetical protein
LANFEFLKNKTKFDILWMKIWQKNSIKKYTPKNSTNVNRINAYMNTALVIGVKVLLNLFF